MSTTAVPTKRAVTALAWSWCNAAPPATVPAAVSASTPARTAAEVSRGYRDATRYSTSATATDGSFPVPMAIAATEPASTTPRTGSGQSRRTATGSVLTRASRYATHSGMP